MSNQAKSIDIGRDGQHDSVSQFLTFLLNSNVYGINILNIKEIVDYGTITRVPMMPDYIAGVINLRGSVVPVVDLSYRFSQKPSSRSKRSSIVILEVKHEDLNVEIGITVDVVNEVVDLTSSEIENTPSFGTNIRTDFINGMGKLNDELLVLLDTDAILSIDELSFMDDRCA